MVQSDGMPDLVRRHLEDVEAGAAEADLPYIRDVEVDVASGRKTIDGREETMGQNSASAIKRMCAETQVTGRRRRPRRR